MRYQTALLALLAMMLFAGGCAAKRTAPDTPHDGGSTEWRLRTLEAKFLEFEEGQRRSAAEAEDRYAELDRRMKDVSAKVEGVSGHVASVEADVIALRNSEELRSRMTAESVPAPSSSVASTAEEPADIPAPVGEVVPLAPAPSPSDSASAAPASSGSASGGDPVSGDAAYHAALALIQSGDAASGRAGMDAFLAANPNSKLVPNALYWVGETYYHEKNYAEAILSFREVTRRFSKHHKAAAAMLKTGYAYQMMGDTENARFYLQALADEFPGSEPATLARKRLARLP